MAVEDLAPDFVEKLNALKLLLDAGADVQGTAQITRVDVDDVISYLDSIGRPMTAWLRRVGAVTRVAIEVGWNGEPSADSLRRLEQPGSGLIVARQIESD